MLPEDEVIDTAVDTDPIRRALPELEASAEPDPEIELESELAQALRPQPELPYLSALAAGVSRAMSQSEQPLFGGSVVDIASGACAIRGLSQRARLEDLVTFGHQQDAPMGQVVRVDTNTVTVRPFSSANEIGIGDRAWLVGAMSLAPHQSWKGRTVNAMGHPIDGKGPILASPVDLPINAKPPPALERQRIDEPLPTGIKAIDLFTPLCRGQRIGIFAGSGVGKSTLLQMLAASPGFDTAVVALVGERGREVREMLEDGLGDAVDRTVAVVATSDESPMMRRLAPATAITIAEYFRDQGDNVILIVDSITRFAHASRDGGVASGEVPVARGYSPSVFSEMAALLERTGPGEIGKGTITGVFSVLVDGDDHEEPIADNIRGTLDGHIVLDRAIAEQGRYPAIDVLRSISRLAPKVWTQEQENLVHSLRAMIARYEEGRDLRMLGGHKPGIDPLVDQAVQLVPVVYDALRQSPADGACPDAFAAIAEALSASAAK
ncbi:MAG: FliI/YscN family ATPase [Pseudomonadota bacterium]